MSRSNGKDKSRGRGDEGNGSESKSGKTAKNPRLKRRTPKPADHTIESVMSALSQKKDVGEGKPNEIVVARGALGIRLLGGLDYLSRYYGTKVQFVSPKRFAALVANGKVTPFLRAAKAAA